MRLLRTGWRSKRLFAPHPWCNRPNVRDCVRHALHLFPGMLTRVAITPNRPDMPEDLNWPCTPGPEFDTPTTAHSLCAIG
jgi:hypothetical protein